MKKRILKVLKRSNYDYFVVITRSSLTNELLNEELITLKGLKFRIINYSKDFENGLININDIDDISVPYLLNFEIEDLRILSNSVNLFVEGVVVEKR